MLPDDWKGLWFAKNITSADFAHHTRIPQILHMVWVGSSNPKPDTFDMYVSQWKRLMPHWQIRIWGDEDITEEHFPADIIAKIHASEKGAQKCDIMKYHIVERYGGVYMDADVEPHRSLDPVIYDLNDADIVLCHDIPLTWEYMAVGFFAAIPHHPVLKLACEILKGATINTHDIHMHTGPQVMGWAMARPTDSVRKCAILPARYFYYNDGFSDRLGRHTYAKLW